MENIKRFNRIKIVLAEKEETKERLRLQLGKLENIDSIRATNKQQSSVKQLFKIAKILNIEVKDLLVTQNLVRL